MGSIADVLNQPTIMEVAGHSIRVKRLSISKVYEIVQKALSEMDEGLRGKDLIAATQKALETGKMPVPALTPLVYAATDGLNDGLDKEDIEAIFSLEHFEKGMKLAGYAVGMEVDEEAQGDEKKVEAGGQ